VLVCEKFAKKCQNPGEVTGFDGIHIFEYLGIYKRGEGEDER
jgi:hypothetical protein